MSPKITATSVVKLNSGHVIPVLGLGVYQTPADVTTDIVYRALKLGYRHVDSAIGYENEKEVVEGIVKFLKEFSHVKREEIYYTTKIPPANFGYEPAKAAIEQSLKHAAPIGYIDLFLIHFPISTKQLRLETYKALQEYAEAGKIKSIGVSNYGIHHFKELFEYPEFKITPAVNQIELHPWVTRKELMDYMETIGVKPEAYSPLVRGLKMDDEQLVALAKKYNATPAQILIRWSADKGFITIPKTVSDERLQENLDSFKIDFSEEDLKALTHDEAYDLCSSQWDPSTYTGV